VRLDELRWECGRLVLRVSGRLLHGDGTPLAFARRDETACWDPPVDLGTEVALEDRDVERDLAESRIDVLVRAREARAEFLLPVESGVVRHEHGGSVTASVVAEARLDPLTGAGGAPLHREIWDVIARVHVGGWTGGARLGADRAEAIPPRLPAAVVGDPGHVVIPFWTAAGNLSVDVDQSSESLAGRVTPLHADVRAERSAVAVAVALPALLGEGAAAKPLQLHAKRSGTVVRAVTVPATLAGSGANNSFARLEARLPLRKLVPRSGFISRGSWKLSVTIGPSTNSMGLVLDVGEYGRLSVRSIRSENGVPKHAPVRASLAERVLFDRSWRRHVPRPLRVGARFALRAVNRLSVSSPAGRTRRG
jgi:poly(ribitol-phosphate) beta-N-acetylglucosaminyltransferase